MFPIHIMHDNADFHISYSFNFHLYHRNKSNVDIARICCRFSFTLNYLINSGSSEEGGEADSCQVHPGSSCGQFPRECGRSHRGQPEGRDRAETGQATGTTPSQNSQAAPRPHRTVQEKAWRSKVKVHSEHLGLLHLASDVEGKASFRTPRHSTLA